MALYFLVLSCKGNLCSAVIDFVLSYRGNLGMVLSLLSCRGNVGAALPYVLVLSCRGNLTVAITRH